MCDGIEILFFLSFFESVQHNFIRDCAGSKAEAEAFCKRTNDTTCGWCDKDECNGEKGDDNGYIGRNGALKYGPIAIMMIAIPAITMKILSF